MMTQPWDEFSKSLAAEMPRRESLRRFGAALAGVFLAPLGLGIAWAAGKDPCKTFCRCRDKTQQNACLAACRGCNGDTSRVCGRCGTYSCCSGRCCGGACSDLLSDPNCGACGNNCGAIGETCCGDFCADLDNDPYNCGACGNVCDEALPHEYGVCFDGECFYNCVEGAIDCDGVCTPVLWDPNNCGACGHVCGGSTPYCNQGACSQCPSGLALCGGNCVSLSFDNANCGACGVVCPSDQTCIGGYCEFSQPYDPTWPY
jgi:hypothetical protein